MPDELVDIIDPISNQRTGKSVMKSVAHLEGILASRSPCLDL